MTDRLTITESTRKEVEFFEQMRSCRDAYRRLADCIHEVVGQQQDAIELGCGVGDMMERWQERKWYVVGADCSMTALEMCPEHCSVMRYDLRTPWVNRAHRHDCVICTETAEHIEAEYADQIVETIALMARKVIVWSAAQPGQEWEGHVNLQAPEYWLAKFLAYGWATDLAKTFSLREMMRERHAQHEHAAANFFVLVTP